MKTSKGRDIFLKLHLCKCNIFFPKQFADSKKQLIFAAAKPNGTIAQLVEQRTENPCVPGSIPGGTTTKR